MQFTSLTFLYFFLAVLSIYSCLRTVRARNLFLIASGYIFYGWWDWRFLLLLLTSTLIDFFVAQRIDRAPLPAYRLRWLLVSCTSSLGILGFFKYFNFFEHSLAAVASKLGLHLDVLTLRVILPVGISFYTFQSLSYTIDVYRGKVKPERDFFTFAAFISFFPQLVAGPIERAGHMFPQFRIVQNVTAEGIRTGVSYCLMGLFTKLVLADNAAAIANEAFKSPTHSFGNTLLGAYAFAVQVYGDFSGYSNIAVGLARILGFDLTQNFRQPYLSLSFQEFWRRWHISLSFWLRDYLYISLGGNRAGGLRTYRNLMITMLLGGLWHGAAWTFIIWGGLHGTYLAVERALRGRLSIPSSRGARLLGTMLTFHLVCLAWIFFRANDLRQAVAMLAGLGNFHFGRPTAWIIVFMLIACTFALDLWRERAGTACPLATWSRVPLGVSWAALILVTLVLTGRPQTFIYFQF